MGNSNSNKGKTKTAPPKQKIQMDGVKHVVLVHHSSTKDEKSQVRHFKDALVHSAPGSINIVKTFNLAEGTHDLYDVTWLDDLNNIILIRLTSQGTPTITDIARKKKYLDENNELHGRVLSVAFGSSLPSGWPPVGARRETPDQRDFCLGQVIENDEFDDKKMKSLVSAIMATK